jgi:cytochrome bd ubiquinol oxidase subunit II
VALILRGVSFEFRSHAESDRSRRLWGAAMVAGSAVIPFGLGIVLGGLLGGVPINGQQDFVGGLSDLLSPYALLTGLTLTLLCLVHGACYLGLRTSGELHARARAAARVLGPTAAVAVLAFCIWTRVASGNGFLLSFMELAAVLAAITAAVLVRSKRGAGAFAATSVTLVAVVVSLFADLYPRVMVSSLGSANDLTAQNTAAGSYALTVMTFVLAVLLPVVLAYQGWTFYVFRTRVRGPRVGDDDRRRVIPAPRQQEGPVPAPEAGPPVTRPGA